MTRALLAALCLAATVAPAVAQNWTISAPGSYTLAANSTSSGLFNIKITASNVTLDLNGKIVQCNAAAGVSSFGIYANNQTNVTIRNGRIAGCQFGIIASYSTNTAVDGVDFTGVRYVGVSGAKVVRDSVFADIAGWTPDAYAIGVNGPEAGCVIERNQFRNLSRQAAGIGAGEGAGVIISANTTGCTIRNNWFENAAVGGSLDIGVWGAVGSSASVLENVFTDFERAVIMPGTATVSDNRLWLRGPVAGSNAIHAMAGSVDLNLIVGFDTPLSGDAPATNNLIIPP